MRPLLRHKTAPRSGQRLWALQASAEVMVLVVAMVMVMVVMAMVMVVAVTTPARQTLAAAAKLLRMPSSCFLACLFHQARTLRSQTPLALHHLSTRTSVQERSFHLDPTAHNHMHHPSGQALHNDECIQPYVCQLTYSVLAVNKIAILEALYQCDTVQHLAPRLEVQHTIVILV